MQQRLALSLLLALLIGLQGPACLALCQLPAGGEVEAAELPPCHAALAEPPGPEAPVATAANPAHPVEPRAGSCPEDCPSCRGDAPLLSAAGFEAGSIAAPLLSAPLRRALQPPPAAPTLRRPALLVLALPPPDVLLAKSSLLL